MRRFLHVPAVLFGTLLFTVASGSRAQLPGGSNSAAIDADAFEYAIAVEQSVIIDADLGIFLGNQLAVDIDAGHRFCPAFSQK